MRRSLIRSPWIAGGVLVALTLVAYAYTVRCGWIWDDDSYVTGNALLTEDGGLAKIWFEPSASPQYYPAVFTSFWVEARLWDQDPTGYHVVNVLLHALCALLWWRVLRAVKLPGAWMAAAVFALHPVHVESVAWVTERKNVLSGVFYVMSLLAWLRFCSLEDDRSPQRRHWGWYGFALIFFVLALLSKSVTATLPAVIVLGLWWKRGSLRAIGRRDAVALVPMFVVGIGMGLHTAAMERAHVGATGATWDFTFVERCLIAGRAVCSYAKTIAWPSELVFIYPRWTIDAAAWWQWMYPLGVVAVVFSLWLLRHRIGRGPVTGVLFFLGTLFPALGFFNVFPMRYSFVADHFQYLASMGLIALASAVVATIAAQQRAVTAAVCAVLLIGLGARTWAQTHMYKDAETLWAVTLEKNPDAWIACVNLGQIRHQAGRYEEAMALYERAIELDEEVPEAWRNIGELLRHTGKLEGAVVALRRAYELVPANADGAMSMAVASVELGDKVVARDGARAAELYRNALEVLREDAGLHNKLGRVLGEAADLEGASRHFARAVELKPNDASLRYNLAMTLAQRGALEEALHQAQVGRELEPEGARFGKLIEGIKGKM